jgi:mono/diheme cytochrome c family protein
VTALKIALLLVLALIAGMALAIYTGLVNVAADDPHATPVRHLIVMLRDRSIEVRSEQIRVPNLEDQELIRTGAGNYDAMCVGCHLAPGLSETELSKGLYPAPPNLTRQTVTDPAETFWIIKHGIKATGMPAWGKSMQDKYLWGLVAFLQKLPTLDRQHYEVWVAASDGHSHGGGELDAHEHGVQTPYPQDAKLNEPQRPVEKVKPLVNTPNIIHNHADGKQHVH